jgi:NAD(P) transhydrogenase subunit alpha
MGRKQWHTALVHALMSSLLPIHNLQPIALRMTNLEPKLFVFLLSTFLGLEVIRRVSPLLHTPLMSLTNAISAIAVVAAIQVISQAHSNFSTVLGTLAVIAATTNIVGGFWITDRMLKMFRRETKKP